MWDNLPQHRSAFSPSDDDKVIVVPVSVAEAMLPEGLTVETVQQVVDWQNAYEVAATRMAADVALQAAQADEALKEIPITVQHIGGSTTEAVWKRSYTVSGGPAKDGVVPERQTRYGKLEVERHHVNNMGVGLVIKEAGIKAMEAFAQTAVAEANA
jgi:hypothetical protein